jgi:hypothetical protein
MHRIDSRNSFVAAVGVLTILGVATLGGCKANPDDVSFNTIKGDLTPEMMTLVERPVDVDRNIAVNWNQNLRNAWMDLGRVFYWDSPSRLSPYDMIPTGGTLK